MGYKYSAIFDGWDLVGVIDERSREIVNIVLRIKRHPVRDLLAARHAAEEVCLFSEIQPKFGKQKTKINEINRQALGFQRSKPGKLEESRTFDPDQRFLR
jgi:hypothetical protein